MIYATNNESKDWLSKALEGIMIYATNNESARIGESLRRNNDLCWDKIYASSSTLQ